MAQVIADRDYTKWREIMDAQPKMSDYVNVDNFDRFAEMHDLMQADDYAGADVIAQELGLRSRTARSGYDGWYGAAQNHKSPHDAHYRRRDRAINRATKKTAIS